MGTKVTDSGLAVVSSPTLESLTDELADRLGATPSDPFASEFIVVPNIGVRDWLQRELGSRLDHGRAGIVANVRFMFVQQFLNSVFAATAFRESSAVEAWNIEHLTWFVHRAIDRIGRPSIPGASTKPLTVARTVADLYDRYGVHRPSMLRYWRNGRAIDAVEPLQDLPAHLRWQQELYAEVCQLIADESPADRLASLDASISEHGLSEALPERLAIFGFSSVNATLRSVLDAVALARSCRIYLLHPTWRGGDGAARDEDRLVPRDHDVAVDTGNPLLTRWGRSALETSRILGGQWTHLADPTASAVSDLDRLRRSIVDDTSLTLAPMTEPSPQLESSDGSLQVHACHGRVRQVEVLRDALLHLLEDDPSLTLDDISIQCPDLVSFAPIIPAIFRSGEKRGDSATPPLDVSIADRVLAGENPYHDAFWSLLDLARSRCGVGEVLTLLVSGPIRRRFDIDDEVLARLGDWFEALNVRFGLDSEHRRRWGVPDSIDIGTWDVALDRLFMGLAVPAREPFEGPGGVVPHDDISVTDAPTLARIADFLSQFRGLVARLDTAHSVGEWADIFGAVVRDFFDESEQGDYSCRDLLDTCTRLRRAAQQAGVDERETFAFDEISSILSDLVVSSSTRPRFRSGAITVTELLPQQGVPYRVIALLGVSESMFTSGGTRGDDVLSLRPCVGDPMPAMSGRRQLLDVVLAAKDAVIITCDGADINNNKPIPLPVPLQELLEAITALRADHVATGSVRVFTRHPRQSFAPRALTHGHFRLDRPFTFDPVALDLHARKQRAPEPVLGARSATGASHVFASKVTAASLSRVLSKPTDYFVQDVLGVRLPSADVVTGSDFVDFWPSNLNVARAGRELLDAVKRSESAPADTVNRLVHQLTLGGSFPPGLLGEVAARQVGAEVLSILESVPEAALRIENYRTMDIDDVTVPVTSSGTTSGGVPDAVISGVIDGILGHDLVRISFTRFRDDHVLGPWMDLALATYVHPDDPWCVRMVARGPKKSAEVRAFTLAGSDAVERRMSAQRAIGVALTTMACASRGRVPFLSRTSEKLSRSSIESSRSTYEGEGEYSPATQFLFGRVSWDDFIAEKPTDFDPDPTAVSRAQMFAHYVWNAFRETTTPVSSSWGVT